MDFSITISRTDTSIKPSHPARDAWILATYFTNVNGKIVVASRKGCVDFSFGTYETEKERDVSHLARDAWILAQEKLKLQQEILSHLARDAWILAS